MAVASSLEAQVVVAFAAVASASVVAFVVAASAVPAGVGADDPNREDLRQVQACFPELPEGPYGQRSACYRTEDHSEGQVA